MTNSTLGFWNGKVFRIWVEISATAIVFKAVKVHLFPQYQNLSITINVLQVQTHKKKSENKTWLILQSVPLRSRACKHGPLGMCLMTFYHNCFSPPRNINEYGQFLILHVPWVNWSVIINVLHQGPTLKPLHNIGKSKKQKCSQIYT